MILDVKNSPSTRRPGFLLAVLALAVPTAGAAGGPRQAPVVQNDTGGSTVFWSDPTDSARAISSNGRAGSGVVPPGPATR